MGQGEDVDDAAESRAVEAAKRMGYLVGYMNRHDCESMRSSLQAPAMMSPTCETS